MQGPGSGANAIVLPSTHLHAHAHPHKQTRPLQTKTGQAGSRPARLPLQPSQTGPLNLTLTHRAAQRRLGASSSRRRPASSSTLSPSLGRRTASCPSNTRSFSGILLDICPRTPCFLFLAAPGSPGRKVCHIVVSSTVSIQVSRMLFAPSKLPKPKPKASDGAGLKALCLPRHAYAMPPTCTHSCLASRRHMCHLTQPWPEAGHKLAIRRRYPVSQAR